MTNSNFSIRAGIRLPNTMTSSRIMEILRKFPKHNRTDPKSVIQEHWRTMYRINDAIKLLSPPHITMEVDGKAYNIYYIEIKNKIYEIGKIKEKINKILTPLELSVLFQYNTKTNHAMIKPHSHCYNYSLAVLKFNEKSSIEKCVYNKICTALHEQPVEKCIQPVEKREHVLHLKIQKKGKNALLKKILENYFKNN